MANRTFGGRPAARGWVDSLLRSSGDHECFLRRDGEGALSIEGATGATQIAAAASSEGGGKQQTVVHPDKPVMLPRSRWRDVPTISLAPEQAVIANGLIAKASTLAIVGPKNKTYGVERFSMSARDSLQWLLDVANPFVCKSTVLCGTEIPVVTGWQSPARRMAASVSFVEIGLLHECVRAYTLQPPLAVDAAHCAVVLELAELMRTDKRVVVPGPPLGLSSGVYERTVRVAYRPPSSWEYGWSLQHGLFALLRDELRVEASGGVSYRTFSGAPWTELEPLPSDDKESFGYHQMRHGIFVQQRPIYLPDGRRSVGSGSVFVPADRVADISSSSLV